MEEERSGDGRIFRQTRSLSRAEALRRLVGAVAIAIVAAGCARASGIAIPTTTLIPHGSTAAAGGYTVDLGEADDQKAPRAWQGPLRIARTTGERCTASDDVAIIEKPIILVGGHLLYVSTYSGSESTLYVVDANDCSLKWTSPHYVGSARLVGGELLLPGLRPVKMAEDGLPTPQ